MDLELMLRIFDFLPLEKGRCPDEVGRRGGRVELILKALQQPPTPPSKFDCVRILPPPLEKRGGN